jgi:3-methyladenine DNA glycosylase AlkD
MSDKKVANEVFEPFFKMIISAADDERNFVKKAVNWSLRSIGKRNVDLRNKAIEVSNELLEMNNKTAT